MRVVRAFVCGARRLTRFAWLGSVSKQMEKPLYEFGLLNYCFHRRNLFHDWAWVKVARQRPLSTERSLAAITGPDPRLKPRLWLFGRE